MSEISKILLTSLLTVFGGVIIFVVGQIFVKFILEPLNEQSKLIGEIANSLNFYANVGARVEQHYYEEIEKAFKLDEPAKTFISQRYEQILQNHYKKQDDAADILRQQSSKLIGITYSIPFYDFWSKRFKRFPKNENIIKAASQIRLMSNLTHESESTEKIRLKIATLLNISIYLQQYDK